RALPHTRNREHVGPRYPAAELGHCTDDVFLVEWRFDIPIGVLAHREFRCVERDEAKHLAVEAELVGAPVNKAGVLLGWWQVRAPHRGCTSGERQTGQVSCG